MWRERTRRRKKRKPWTHRASERSIPKQIQRRNDPAPQLGKPSHSFCFVAAPCQPCSDQGFWRCRNTSPKQSILFYYAGQSVHGDSPILRVQPRTQVQAQCAPLAAKATLWCTQPPMEFRSTARSTAEAAEAAEARASAPPSPTGRVRLGWEDKSIKFIKHTIIAKPETTISLQRLYEILQSTPAKKQRDTRPDLSPDVVSLCLQ